MSKLRRSWEDEPMTEDDYAAENADAAATRAAEDALYERDFSGPKLNPTQFPDAARDEARIDEYLGETDQFGRTIR